MALLVNLAYYDKQDWKRFLEIIDDREKQHDNWENWFRDFIKMKNELLTKGYTVNEVHVNLDELINYCKKSQIKIDGKARSSFVAKARLKE